MTLVDTTAFWARLFQHLAAFLTNVTSTGSVLFSLSICLIDVIKFVLLSLFTLIETICLKICSKSRHKSKKSTSGSRVSLKNVAAETLNSLCEMGNLIMYKKTLRK